MSEHRALVTWQRGGADFAANRYSREHAWAFDEGVVVTASASPDVVPLPLSTAAAVDPEEAFVAALSSCHMLFFLSIAQKRGYVVERYRDAAVGRMGKNPDGRTAITTVTLHPQAEYEGDGPDAAALERMHRRAHELCFIANSVTADVVTEIVS